MQDALPRRLHSSFIIRHSSIREVVVGATAMSEAEHRNRSKAALQAVLEKHTPDRFRSDLREAVEMIVRGAGKEGPD